MACVWVVAVEAQVAGAGVAGQPGREVVDEFAHCDGYGSGEMVVIGEGEQAGPGVEVRASSPAYRTDPELRCSIGSTT